MSAGRMIWLMIVAGIAGRLALAFGTVGLNYDIDSFAIVNSALRTEGLEFYGVVNAISELPRWPYPPAFLPAVLGAAEVADLTGFAFHGLIQTPAIAADAALVLIIDWFLRSRDRSDRTRIASAALIMFGPIFILISGYHGQIDSLAILPIVGAAVIWLNDGNRRALTAGLLIGIAIALKTFPVIALLAFLPTARTRREAIELIGGAVAVPGLLLAPFAIADPGGVATLTDYGGSPGLGGLSMLAQPGLVEDWLTVGVHQRSGLTNFLIQYSVVLNGAVAAGLAFLLLRTRPDILSGMILVTLGFWVFGSGFFYQYLIWGIPFFILAGRLWEAAGIQLLATGPALIFYLGPWAREIVFWTYGLLAAALFAVLAVLLIREVRAVLARGHVDAATPV